MRVLLTRPLHEAMGDEIAAGTVLDRDDAEQLIALGGALPVTEDSPPNAAPAAKSSKLRRE